LRKDGDKMRLKPSFKVNIIFLLAIFFGLAAAWGVRTYLLDIKEKYRTSGNFTPVVFAVKHIPKGTKISPNAIAVKDIPQPYVNKSAVSNPKEVIGKITTNEIFPDEQIIRERYFEGVETEQGLAYHVPEGERAVTVAVNKVSGIAGLIRSGNRVDVFATIEKANDAITTFVVQNVKVLAVDRTLNENEIQPKGGIYPETVTLALTTQQAQKVILASEQGSIRLALRSPVDIKTINLQSISLEDVFK